MAGNLTTGAQDTSYDNHLHLTHIFLVTRKSLNNYPEQSEIKVQYITES